MGFLEKGQSQPIGLGTRFYIADRLESTVMEVVEGEAAGDEGVRTPGWQQAGTPEEGTTSNAAKRPKLQGAAAGSTPPLLPPAGAAGPASAIIGMHQAPFSLMRVRCVGRCRAVQGGTWRYMAVQQGHEGQVLSSLSLEPWKADL